MSPHYQAVKDNRKSHLLDMLRLRRVKAG